MQPAGYKYAVTDLSTRTFPTPLFASLFAKRSVLRIASHRVSSESHSSPSQFAARSPSATTTTSQIVDSLLQTTFASITSPVLRRLAARHAGRLPIPPSTRHYLLITCRMPDNALLPGLEFPCIIRIAFGQIRCHGAPDTFLRHSRDRSSRILFIEPSAAHCQNTSDSF